MSVLADLDSATETDLASLDDAALKALAAKAQTGRKVVSGLLTRIGAEARRREATGSSAPAEDLSDPGGDQSMAAKAADRERSRLPEHLPGAGETATDGSAKVENADYLARRVRGLSPTELDRLEIRDADIAVQLAAMDPDAFRIRLTRLLLQVADRDDDLSAAERAALSAAFKLFRRPDGTWILAGQLDDERSAVLKDIIERRAAQIADRRPAGQRRVSDNDRAAALVDLVTRRTGAAGGQSADDSDARGAPPGRDCDDDLAAPVRMGVGVIIDAQTLIHGPHDASVAETWRGDPLDPAAAARLACDTDVYAMLYDRRRRRHRARQPRPHLAPLAPPHPRPTLAAGHGRRPHGAPVPT